MDDIEFNFEYLGQIISKKNYCYIKSDTNKFILYKHKKDNNFYTYLDIISLYPISTYINIYYSDLLENLDNIMKNINKSDDIYKKICFEETEYEIIESANNKENRKYIIIDTDNFKYKPEMNNNDIVEELDSFYYNETNNILTFICTYDNHLNVGI